MNFNYYLQHETVSHNQSSYFVKKPDGVIELTMHDCACPPGTVGGLRLNSTATWIRVNNGEWLRIPNNKGIDKALKWAVVSDDTETFIQLLDC
jgi:hypothetical protein